MKPKTLEELNHNLDLWIQNHYHTAPHSSLSGISPEVAFRSDSRPLNFVDIETITEAFLHTDTREVDKTGCIDFKGKKYEVGLQLIGRKVEVYYDPSWTDEIEIHHPDFKPFKAKQQVIGRNCGTRAELPESIRTIKTEKSRLLEGLNEANITHRTNKEVAVVFRKIKEVNADV